MMLGMPRIIKSARGVEPSKTIMRGIIDSAYLTSFQRQAMDGIVTSASPRGEIRSAPVGKSDKRGALLHKVKAGKTHQDIGVVHYQGSKYPPRRRT